MKLFEPVCLVEGKNIPDAKEDFRIARKVEQYRISDAALYLPEGLRWNYIPLTEVQKADESFRVISAGHCVPVREKRPELDLVTSAGRIHLQLEKQDNMQIILEALHLADSV